MKHTDNLSLQFKTDKTPTLIQVYIKICLLTLRVHGCGDGLDVGYILHKNWAITPSLLSPVINSTQ